MRANEVRPQKWLLDVNYPIRVLYDDGDYSAIWGKYENIKALGVRWNGGTDIGYAGGDSGESFHLIPL